MGPMTPEHRSQMIADRHAQVRDGFARASIRRDARRRPAPTPRRGPGGRAMVGATAPARQAVRWLGARTRRPVLSLHTHVDRW
jgi:hypothetical protein